MKNKTYKNIILILISMFVAVAININLETSITFFESINTDEIVLIVMTVLYYVLLSKVIEIKDRRAQMIAIILAIIFAVFEIIGYSTSKYLSLDGIIGSKTILLKNIIKFVGYVITFYSILLLVFTKLLNKIKYSKITENTYFKSTKISFFICTLIIFIAYIPYFLHYYPGVFTTDSITEMNSAIMDMGNLLNHHPVFHIVIVSICLNIGKFLGNYTIGIAIYSVLQMLATSMIFSYTLSYMRKKNVNTYIRIIALAIFALYPPFAVYSMTMWKDVPFALVVLLFTIQIFELITNSQYLKKARNIIKLIIISILVILFRNNGIYVLVITLPLLIIFLKQNRKELAIAAITVIAFYLILKGPIFSMFNIKDGPVREALSVPLQQIARTVKYQEQNLTQEQKDKIYKYLPVENLGEKYYPLISDNVKDNFNNEEFKENKADFISIWIELLCKYPKEYFEAFFDNSFGYWYPQAINWVIPTWYDYPENEIVPYEKAPIVEIKVIDHIEEIVNYRKIPIISMSLSIGFAFWVLLVMSGYVIYKKKYSLILSYIPILALWLTTLASPVWCEYRYIYSMFTCMPILTILVLCQTNKTKEENINQVDNKEKEIDEKQIKDK